MTECKRQQNCSVARLGQKFWWFDEVEIFLDTLNNARMKTWEINYGQSDIRTFENCLIT